MNEQRPIIIVNDQWVRLPMRAWDVRIMQGGDPAETIERGPVFGDPWVIEIVTRVERPRWVVVVNGRQWSGPGGIRQSRRRSGRVLYRTYSEE